MAEYCGETAHLIRKLAELVERPPEQPGSAAYSPFPSTSTFEDWEGDYEQVRFAIEHAAFSLIACFLRDHVRVQAALDRALNPIDPRGWQLVWVRKGRGRPSNAPDPAVGEFGSRCARDGKIALLIANYLEDSGHPPQRNACVIAKLLGRHVALLERLADRLGPRSPRGTYLAFRRKGAGRRLDPVCQSFKDARTAMRLRFETKRANGKQESAIAELKPLASRAAIFRSLYRRRDR